MLSWSSWAFKATLTTGEERDIIDNQATGSKTKKCKYNRILNIRHFIWEWVWFREGTLQSSLKGSLVETKRREKSRLHKQDNRRKTLVLCSRNKDPLKDHPGGRRKNVRWIRRKSPKEEEKRCYFSNSDTTLWQLGQKHWMGEKKGKKFPRKVLSKGQSICWKRQIIGFAGYNWREKWWMWWLPESISLYICMVFFSLRQDNAKSLSLKELV